ncbi:hypothetical protein SAY86_028529 [Trapa natans]|uniref:RPW8 domain-containing protein n=1 Tax=Trapa natans TaxID=22666 RepID=A0AAN7RGH4_TRANT|nr:hypothetical protein SAY86_028529 [Trapa natans]
MSSSKWSAYEDLCYTRMLDKIEKGMHLHMYSAISKMHSKLSESFGQMDDSMRSLEQQVTEMRFGSVSKSNPRISSPARLRPMPRTDFFTGEIATELLKALLYIVGKSSVCKSSAKHFITTIKRYVSIVQEIKDSGEELPEVLQCELDRFHKEIKKAQMLCYEIINTGKWNVYKNLRYSWKLDEIDKGINRFNLGSMQLHMYASICKMSSKTRERFDQIEGSMKRIQQQITDKSISGSWVEKAIQSQGQEQSMWEEEGLGQRVVIGLEAGKKKVKQMLMTLREDLRIVGIHGIGGSGKTTLAKEIFRDEQIKEHFNNKMLFLTVSQSPNINYLKARILGFLMGNDSSSMHNRIPAWFPQYGGLNCMPVPALIVLDDVWNFKDLELLMLIEGYSGCKILVVSRSRFPVVVQTSYEVECLKEHEAMTLFCLSAFQQPSIPPGANENLVKQVCQIFIIFFWEKLEGVL